MSRPEILGTQQGVYPVFALLVENVVQDACLVTVFPYFETKVNKIGLADPLCYNRFAARNHCRANRNYFSMRSLVLPGGIV